MIVTICFYIFATITVLSGLMVISSRNPVHSVLFLILAFFNSAALFLLLGAEFLAMILVIVYVGAVAVLFLFVVMMLDIDFVELRKGFQSYLPIGATIGLILLAEIALVVAGWQFSDNMTTLSATQAPITEEVSNTVAMGRLLYTDYIFLFQMAGMILLVAMIGAIVLTHRKRPGVKKQNISEQVRRRRSDAYEIVKVKPGQGA
ncbi:NADH-quinone oxidoreductase subunit J [Luteithermobacter gelatinilyticus]|uniref:NADH-quinone oxidoreductase subunit J n=1 Tax=Luteithermobacter gelatinilyticus TaxID=2582913 RepID=UPI0011074317|nr:NADH-quinone oxidoreductase subunit J [Luteithermobacter gelatinilyticus]|tara:strand:+ start:2165 stop:2776 length:612 start_codon:yes stop_codon:yes gene_type:complete